MTSQQQQQQQQQSPNFSLSSPKPQLHQQYNHYNTSEKRKLENVRVVQHNLVYVTNIPLNFLNRGGSYGGGSGSGSSSNNSINNSSSNNDTNVLSQSDYFGQYGKIIKLVVNYSVMYNSSTSHGPTVSCYVTYLRNEDAAACINAVNGAWLGGKLLRASFGTTKYCTFFLKGIACTNPDCLYLHKLGSEQDSFTKETMAAGKNLFSDCVHPKVSYSDKGNNVFPPPVLSQTFSCRATIPYEQAAQALPPKYGDVISAGKTWKNFAITVSTVSPSKKVYTAYVPPEQTAVSTPPLSSAITVVSSAECSNATNSRAGDSLTAKRQAKKSKEKPEPPQQQQQQQSLSQGSSSDGNDEDNNDEEGGTDGCDDDDDGTESHQDKESPESEAGTANEQETALEKEKESSDSGIAEMTLFETLMSPSVSTKAAEESGDFGCEPISMDCDCTKLLSAIQKANDNNEGLLYSPEFYQALFSPTNFPQQQQQQQQTPGTPQQQYTFTERRFPSKQSTFNRTRFAEDAILTRTAFPRNVDAFGLYNGSSSNNNCRFSDFDQFTLEASFAPEFEEDQVQMQFAQQKQQQIDPNDIGSQLLVGCDFGVSRFCEQTFGDEKKAAFK